MTDRPSSSSDEARLKACEDRLREARAQLQKCIDCWAPPLPWRLSVAASLLDDSLDEITAIVRRPQRASEHGDDEIRRCFAFLDLAGYTALTEHMGDQVAADSAARLYEAAEGCLAGDTRIVKRIGDAVMLVSTVPADCLRTACAVVQLLQSRPEFPDIRGGLFVGSAVERDGDYFGGGPNLAARLAAHARAGEVVMGGAGTQEAFALIGARAVSMGALALRNVSDPVEAWAWTPPRDGPEMTSVDPVCRMRVTVPQAWIAFDGRQYAFCSSACADRFRASPREIHQQLATRMPRGRN